MRLRQFVVDGLGHLSALIADEEAGAAAVIDPRRDVDIYLREAAARDLRITHVVETHLHNDYVSGGRDLAALTGAQHVIGAGAELAYRHRPVGDGESFEVGTLRFSPIHTPGHTPEHMAYAVADLGRSDDPLLLFTGGSLLVGSVGRTDLLGAEQAVPFARAQFRSLHEAILRHEDHVAVFPTHGAGSLCSAGIGSTPWSTLGYERRHNPRLQPADVETFVRTLLADQPTFPRYFARMRPTNQGGPALLGGRIPDLPPLPVDEVRSVLDRGGLVVDLRSAEAHAVEHIPGSLSIPAGSAFGTWLGWVVEPDRPLVLLLDDPSHGEEAMRQALRIGYEGALVGHVQGGFDRWTASGGAVRSSSRISIGELALRLEARGPDAPFVVDVRQATEYAEGHIPGSWHLGAGELPDRLAELPRDRAIVTICAAGYRASIAASLLRQAGFADVSSVAEGVPAWQFAGYPVASGDDRTG